MLVPNRNENTNQKDGIELWSLPLWCTGWQSLPYWHQIGVRVENYDSSDI
jgi:hypothetical protein